MKFLFRVDASLSIGTGHVMRCLALARKLKKNNCEIEFISRKHEGNIIKKIRENGFKVYELEVVESPKFQNRHNHSSFLGASQIQDAEACKQKILGRHYDWFVIDHYSIDSVWEKELKPFYDKLIVIDDLADRKHISDILIDQTFLREEKAYKKIVPKSCTLLLGPEYALLREEFSKYRNLSLKKRENSKLDQIFINLGGTDLDNYTRDILRILSKIKLPHAKIKVVIGSNSPHTEKIISEAAELPNCEVLVDVQNMAELMSESDIAIGASGSSTWERCSLGLPTIQIPVANNQFEISKKLSEHNVVESIDMVDEIPALLETAAEWMSDKSKKSSEICDGNGCSRVLHEMKDHKLFIKEYGEIELCNYVNLCNYERDLTLEMRNHPSVSSMMLSQQEIGSETHRRFLEELEHDKSKVYFLVKHDLNLIGSINFSNIKFGHHVDFGIFTNPFLKLAGKGSILESAASIYAFNILDVKKIRLEVISDNFRAFKFYKKHGYQFIDKKKINKREIISMEKVKK